MNIEEYDEELYVCPVCGHEDYADKFGKYCPKCDSDLDEVEEELE
jgi:rubrerythrin